jgi:hypothetical protein
MSDRPNPARELADSGTPGPWRITQRDTGNWIDAGEYDEVLAPEQVECMAYCYGGSSAIEMSDTDAAKIVRAVNALPAIADLLDAIEGVSPVRRTHSWGSVVNAAAAVEAALRGDA